MKKYFLIILYVVFISGCVSTKYSYVEPDLIEPTLTPILKWKPYNDSKSYDLAVWESIWIPSEKRYAVGKRIHYVEKIVDIEYQLPIQLKNNLNYYWSVRPHGAMNWSKVSISDYLNQSWESSLFKFLTKEDE